MEQKSHKPEKGLILSIILAVIFGVFSFLSISLVTVVFIVPVLFMWLYARNGLVPVAVGTVIQTAGNALFFGTPAAIVLFVAQSLPVFVCVRFMREKLSFAEQMKRSLVVWIVAVAVALALGQKLAGTDLVSVLVSVLEEGFASMPTVTQDVFLQMVYGNGTQAIADPQALMNLLFRESLTAAQRAEWAGRMFAEYANSLRIILPGTMLTAAALTAVLSTTWANVLSVKRGKLPKECAAPLYLWHLPPSATFGLIGIYIVSIVLDEGVKIDGGLAVSFAVQQLASLAFAVQGVGSLERMLVARNMRRGGRIAILLVMILIPFLQEALIFYGMFSALMGVHFGAIPAIMKQRRDRHSDDE